MEVEEIANKIVDFLDSKGDRGRSILEKVREILLVPSEEEMERMHEDYINTRSNGVLNNF
jgi:DNA-directed RNA polymerase subunit F